MSGRRFGRRKSGSGGVAANGTDSLGNYIPPGLDGSSLAVGAVGGGIANSTTNSGGIVGGLAFSSFPPVSYVTQPPKPRQGLTGKISTLFRQKSREYSDASDVEGRAGSGRGGNISSSDRGGYASSSSRKSAISKNAPPRRSTHHHPQGVVDTDDDLGAMSDAGSVGSRASANKRIFYSSHQDDDSDDSYESRVSRASRTSRASQSGVEGDTDDDGGGGGGRRGGGYGEQSDPYTTDEPVDGPCDTVIRFRGFSTSISSFFLDEALVCAAIGCFGLMLSNRTEYLLQLRNDRRGLSKKYSSNRRLPSRIVAYGLLLTLVLMFATFCIWGFGTGNGLADDYFKGYNYNSIMDENGNQNSGNTDDRALWDDYLQNNNNNRNKNYNNDNDYNNNYNNGNGQQGDDYYNKYNGGNNNNNQKGDDYYKNYNNNYYQNGNYNNNYNNYYKGDDYYRYGGGNNGNNRMLGMYTSNNNASTDSNILHIPNGIFKLRDYHEHLWQPISHLAYEWQQLVQEEKEQQQQPRQRQRTTFELNAQGHRREQYSYSSQYDDAFSVAQETRKERNIASTIRLGLLFAFMIFLGVLGRRRRMRTRFYLVRARAQEDHLYYASSDQAAARRVAFEDTREDQYEGACAHTLCGCYPIDDVDEREDDTLVEVTDSGIFKRKKKPYHQDFVARVFSCLLSACCGTLCRCWFQCVSVCALAQEAREVRLLLPPRYQRVDYITHQPFHEYQKNVNDLRRGWMGQSPKLSGIVPHYNALSRLSRYVVMTFFLTVVSLAATLCFNPRAAFSWQDAIVLAATFLQSFLVLFIVHWIFHKSDLSLDAVIKFFAAGFLVAVPTAFVFEGLMVNVVLIAGWICFYAFEAIGGKIFSLWVFDHWRLLWIIGELFNAYIVAAVVEELCKYYTFRAVEHPDLIFITGLQREDQDETAVDGGIVKYPFASHQVQEWLKDNDDSSVASRRSTSSKRSARSSRSKGSRDARTKNWIETTGTTDVEFDEDESDIRTYRQKAMAITTAMISVAVGLACAENCLYVFLLGGALGAHNPNEEHHRGDVMEAWIVLFFRSIFPVHALAAAMQSVNMIRKFVETGDESGHRIGVGRVILPAVILHGSFDAVLMGINVYVETAWDKYLSEHEGNVGEDDPYNAFLVNLIAWVSISLIMISGIAWYYREHRNQRLRLILLEERERQERDGYRVAVDGAPPAPPAPLRREAELA